MKKIKAMISTIIILTIALMLTACSALLGEKTQPTSTETPFPTMTEVPLLTEAPAVTETPVSEESTAPQLCSKGAALYAEFSEESTLSQMSDLKSITDSESEFAYKVLFTAQRDIKNLRYLAISADLTDAGEISVQDEKVLYTLDGMNDGEPLVISMALEGYIPDRAVSYEDDCGGTHYFYITVSGEDNVPILVSFER